MYSYNVRSDGQLDEVRRARTPPASPSPPAAPAKLSPALDSEVLLIGALMFLLYTSGGKKPDWLLLAALGYLLL